MLLECVTLEGVRAHQAAFQAIADANGGTRAAGTDGYDASVDNLDRVSLDSDMVFSDGYSLQLAAVTGSVDEGYTFSLNVPV